MTGLEINQLTQVINARGVFTPIGVSRSSVSVATATGGALSRYFIMDELQALVGQRISELTGAQAVTLTHCCAASITLAVAGAMTGNVPEKIAALPDTSGMKSRVVIPRGHAVNYGQPIEQAIRLAGAHPVLVGTPYQCLIDALVKEIDHDQTCAVLLVSSRLTTGVTPDFSTVIEAAHRAGVPVIIDGAAQDMRIAQLLATDADAVLVSAQKYLAGPTAGMVIGKRALIDAVSAQEKGIGRAMKASKEALVGTLAALFERSQTDMAGWQKEQARKLAGFIAQVNDLSFAEVSAQGDQTGLPFSRVHLKIDERESKLTALELASALRSGDPSIWVMDQKAAEGELAFELVQVSDAECDSIIARLHVLLD